MEDDRRVAKRDMRIRHGTRNTARRSFHESVAGSLQTPCLLLRSDSCGVTTISRHRPAVTRAGVVFGRWALSANSAKTPSICPRMGRCGLSNTGVSRIATVFSLDQRRSDLQRWFEPFLPDPEPVFQASGGSDLAVQASWSACGDERRDAPPPPHSWPGCPFDAACRIGRRRTNRGKRRAISLIVIDGILCAIFGWASSGGV
jgi:hypothetical protein